MEGTFNIGLAPDEPLEARIKVVGVGGGGSNAVERMITEQLSGVEFIVANTDYQALQKNSAQTRVQLGPELTRGLGAGGDPTVGQKAAREVEAELGGYVEGADMVFVTAGMGGGTGTGAAPVVARAAREQGALTVGVVTKPFHFEGRRRMAQAEAGIEALSEEVDALIVIPNQRLLELPGGEDLTFMEAMERADDVLLHAVRGISDLVTQHGMINVDFADVKAVMSNQGRALMGMGVGHGEDKALQAVEQAMGSPLLDNVGIEGARGILINFTAGMDIKLSEVDRAAQRVREQAHEEANIIFGLVMDPDLSDEVRVTLVATGFEALSARPGSQRAAAAVARGGAASSSVPRQAARPSSRPSAAPAASRSSQPPASRPSAPRAFGAQAVQLGDQEVLEVPAYLRRSSVSGAAE